MKKIITCILTLAIPSLIFSQIKYSITGKIDRLSEKAKVYINYADGDTDKLDTGNVINGGFVLTGFISKPVLATIYLGHAGESFPDLRYPDMIVLYIDSGRITLRSTDSLVRAIVSGPTVTTEYEEFKSITKPFEARYAAIKAEERKVPQELYTSEKDADFDKQYQAVDNDRIPVLEAFIEQHPKSIVSIDALWMRGGAFPDWNVLDPLFQSLSNSVKTTKSGIAFTQLLNGLKATAVGAQAPIFTQNDKDGKLICLSDFKGKYVLIDFWASWCGPCRKENPNLVKIYNLFKNKNFTILSISLDLRKEAWLKAIENDKLEWTQVSDLKYWKNEAATLYSVHAVPQNFLIDPSGKIIARNLSHDDLMAKLNNIYPMAVFKAN